MGYEVIEASPKNGNTLMIFSILFTLLFAVLAGINAYKLYNYNKPNTQLEGGAFEIKLDGKTLYIANISVYVISMIFTICTAIAGSKIAGNLG